MFKRIYIPVLVLLVLFAPFLFSHEIAAVSSYEQAVAEENLERLHEEYDLTRIEEGDFEWEVLDNLTSQARRDGVDLEFSLYYADSEEVNGLYIGDGNIVIFSGLADLLYEEELAALIAHEMGHGVHGHLDQNLRNNLGLFAGRFLLDRLFGEEAASSQFYQRFVGLAMNLMDRGFSREQEREADIYAVELLHRTPEYNPEGMIGLLEVLNDLRGKKDPQLLEIFNTHPYPENRLEYTRERISELESGN